MDLREIEQQPNGITDSVVDTTTFRRFIPSILHLWYRSIHDGIHFDFDSFLFYWETILSLKNQFDIVKDQEVEIEMITTITQIAIQN